MTTIYDRIKYLRVSLGLSQSELAKLVGYTGRSAISKVEAGERDISQSMIAKYAAALHVTPTYLLFGQPDATTIQVGDVTSIGNTNSPQSVNVGNNSAPQSAPCGLMDMYNLLTADNRNKVIIYTAQLLAEQQKSNAEKGITLEEHLCE